MMTAADLERLGYEIIDGKAVKKRPAPPPPVLDPSATPGIGPNLEPPVAGGIPWVPPPDVTKSERELLIPVPRPMLVARGGQRRPWKEKDEQRECWRLLLGLNFSAKWLSQTWVSGQSKGVPDLLARHRGRRVVLWMEVKNSTDPAPWTPEQRAFCSECLPGIETYVLGTEANLRVVLKALGFELPPMFGSFV